MLHQLPFFLTWRYYWDLPALTQTVFEYYVSLGWERWLARLEQTDAAAHDRISRLMEGLPEASRLRFLTAPEAYRMLCTPNRRSAADGVAFALSSLLAEEARLGQGPPPEGEHWTALGDCGFTGAGGEPARRFDALTLDSGIVLDTASPHAYLEANDRGEPVAADEMAALQSALGEAAGRLCETAAAAHQALSTCVKVITVRRDPARPATSSSSWPWLVGKMGLANPAALTPDQRCAALAGALVHEAIHALVYRIELVDPLYTSDEAAQEVRTVSPWSQRELRLHSFVHACFVWFGLWSFWSLAETSGAFAPETAREHREQAAFGFRDPGLPGQLSGLAPHLTPAALAAIRRLGATVLGAAAR